MEQTLMPEEFDKHFINVEMTLQTLQKNKRSVPETSRGMEIGYETHAV